MPPDRGRASKACTTCRKQKTRCYPTVEISASCLRCQTLGLQCSFSNESRIDGAVARPHVAVASGGSESDTNARLQRLEETVRLLVDRLDGAAPQSHEQPRSIDVSSAQHAAASIETIAAPMLIIRDLAVEADDESQSSQNQSPNLRDDIISQALVDFDDAVNLIAIFHKHYGRWVGFEDEIAPELLIHYVRRSPMLLCACCLIAVRHTTQEAASRITPQAFQQAKSMLSDALLSSSQTLDFFQTALILSMWSTTLGRTPMTLDSWLLSSFALEHCLSSSLFSVVMGQVMVVVNTSELITQWSIWNHLCLVHLHYCIGTKRKSAIGLIEINRCQKMLEFDRATNFQIRMVAEINLYWCMYTNLNDATFDLVKTQQALDLWKQDWKFLLDQPRSQFLQMGFNFAHLLAYEKALHTRSTRVKNTLLNEMANLCSAIVKLAMETTDERTKHLSDHIYHLITFAAVTLCRLLHLYEPQLARSHTISDLDGLILQLVSWLHSIGLPCHVAYTLGTVIAAFHKKLRPDSHITSTPVDWPTPWSASELTQFFPDLIGNAPMDGDSWNYLPDWEPFFQGPLT